jgi:excinuclease UvrABC nuclease subunit
MRKFKKVTIYPTPGRTAIPESRNRSGVYFIYDQNELVYVGSSSSNVYKTLTRHFQQWNDRTQIRITYPQTPNYKVRIIYCTPKQAAALEFAAIKKMKPRDNPNKYDLFELDAYDKQQYNTMNQTPAEEVPF